jgi:hypothetical protein
MPVPTQAEIDSLPKILYSSPLTMPWRADWGRGLSAADVEHAISQNFVQEAIVNAAGGSEEWVRKTAGGMLDPHYWPFRIPLYEEVYPPAADTKPKPDVLPAILPGIPAPGEPAYVKRIEAKLDLILDKL